MSYRKLLREIGGQDSELNLIKIAESMSKTSWIAPDLTNIFSEGGVYAYPVTSDDVTTTYNIDSTGTTIKTIVAGTTSGVDYKVEPDGEVPLLAAASAAAIFGAETDVTNCMLMLIELPTTTYANVSVALDAGSATALTEDNVIVGDDVCYYAYPLGLYDSTGIKSVNSKITLTHNGKSVKYEFDLTDITLKVAG